MTLTPQDWLKHKSNEKKLIYNRQDGMSLIEKYQLNSGGGLHWPVPSEVIQKDPNFLTGSIKNYWNK